jgi:hypothetical protein
MLKNSNFTKTFNLNYARKVLVWPYSIWPS